MNPLLIKVLLALGASLLGFGAFEVHKAREKNTPPPIVKTVAAVQAVAETHAADDVARDAKEKAKLESEQAAAGFLAGALLYFDANPSPTPQRLVRDAAALLPPATSAQEKEFALILQAMKAQNDAALAAKEVQIAILNGNLALSTSKEAQTRKDADLAVQVAQKDAASVKTVHVTFVARVKAWLWGLGSIGLGGAILLPLIAMAFPALVPVCRAISAPVLALWHALAAKEKALIADLHQKAVTAAAVAEAKLASEVTAHAATKDLALKIATAP